MARRTARSLNLYLEGKWKRDMGRVGSASYYMMVDVECHAYIQHEDGTTAWIALSSRTVPVVVDADTLATWREVPGEETLWHRVR